MSRGYTAEFENETIANAQGNYDHFVCLLADERRLLPTVLVLDVLSELGDAAEEHIRIQIVGNSNWGTGGIDVTPRPHDPNDVAFSSTSFQVNNPTVPAIGTGVYLMSDGFNVRIGYRRGWERGPSMNDGYRNPIQVRNVNGVMDDVQMSGTLSFVDGA